MQWEKIGKIIKVDNNSEWMKTHSAVPVVEHIKEDVFKVYFATRDSYNHAQIAYLTFNINNINNIIEISQEPVLSKGEMGFFDEEGVFPSSLVEINNKKYLYYVGWNNHSKSCIFQTSAGIAIQKDNKFTRLYTGPILDRSIHDPTLIATYDIMNENNKFHMWYTSGIKWDETINGLQSYYHIKYAESDDGLNWKRDGQVCIDFKSKNERNIGRPTVIKDNGIYKMWYCYASIDLQYRIGYAESTDGLSWIRKDNEVGIDISEDSWDSKMIAYPNVFKYKERLYMLYCGNNYGKEGLGLAILKK